MHPVDAILQEYNVTRYSFNKTFNFNKNRISNIALRNTPVDSLPVDIIKAMSQHFNISMDEVYSKLKAYESSKQ
ncbi:hypothetical protein [Thomasclavelia cocleata]|uniref:hypothetical protein n=1 Tax=Thomasclavelia cocleata TaxID=69824 RepID=UPI00257393E1|nr:hypothetical protein [Thomasclavelia cocleata]